MNGRLAEFAFVGVICTATQVMAAQEFWLDFNTFTDAVSDDGKDHVYSAAERLAIVDTLNAKFADYPVAFTDVEPAMGLFSTVFFNVGLSDSGDIDFQNRNPIDNASIHIPKLLEVAGLSAPFASADVVTASVNIAAHESLHLLGTRHHDSYLPIGGGVPSAFVGAGYTPAFPGPAMADLSVKELNSLTTSIGFSAAKLLDPDLFVGPRSAVKLLLSEFVDVDVDSADANFAMMPQVLTLKTIPIPNPFSVVDPFLGSFKIFADVAVVEEASIEMSDFGPVPESDYYAIFAEEGDVLHIEVLSEILDARLTPFDVAVELRNPLDGFAPVPWFGGNATSFDERESSDAFLWDVFIPATGSYLIEVTHDFAPGTSDGRMFGEYEMLVYRIRAEPVPEPTSCVLLMGLGPGGVCARLRRRGGRG